MRLLLLWVLVLAGCAAKGKTQAAYGYDEGWSGDDGWGVAETAAAPKPSRSAPASRPQPPPPPPPQAPSGGVVSGEADFYVDEPAPAAEEPRRDRMVHYDGFARLRVTRTDEALLAVEAVADEVGGRVERLAGDTVSVRVPAARFDEAWERVLLLGDVLDRSVRADDVTEQFTAIDLRTRTLRATRDRLVDLLGKATEEQEKLALLREITRVTEQLDQVEAQLRALADLAAFARISVQVVPREAFTGSVGPDLAGFEWIRALSPFRRAVFDDAKRIPLPEPEGLVTLDPRGPFVAESADGTVLWTLRLPNDPVGDGAFWVAAIEDRIGDDFAGTRRADLGRWACLIMDQPGEDEPYRWQVCLRPEGRHLHVAQAFFPGPEQVERYGPRIDAALVGGDS